MAGLRVWWYTLRAHRMCVMCAGDIIKPQGAFQSALFWLMPVIQPLLCLVMAGLAAFTVAYAGVAALHFQPYVAPLLVSALCCNPRKDTA